MEEIVAELASLVGRSERDARNLSGPVLAPVSIGELIDKIVILEIKAVRISDPGKLVEISKELNLLNQIDYGSAESRQQIDALKGELRQINETLWDIEDRICDCERGQDFGPQLVELARADLQDQRPACGGQAPHQ